MSRRVSSAASGRSAGSGTPAASSAGRSGPSDSGTVTGRSTRAISVPMVVSVANGTEPVTDSISTRASE